MQRLPIEPSDLAQLCQRHHILRLSLFGSFSRDAGRADGDRANSDIDLLVEFEAGLAPGLLGLASIEEDLSNLLGGRRVDLRTPRDLSRHFRQEVIDTAEVQFAA